MNLVKYLSVFNIGLQNTFVYRWNYFLRALFGLIPLAGTVFLWRAIFEEPGGKGFGGYDYGSMIYYYLLTILVSNLVTPTEDDWQIAADIREGQINSFLTKPLNYLGYRTGIFLAGRLVYTAVTIIPIALIFFYFRDYIQLPSSVVTYVLSITSLVMAAFIQFFITAVLARLLTRHWIITDANGNVKETRGDGVVGEQPYLKPGQGFRYSTGAVIETPVGTMQGSYQMVADDGQQFDAPIAPFAIIDFAPQNVLVDTSKLTKFQISASLYWLPKPGIPA